MVYHKAIEATVETDADSGMFLLIRHLSEMARLELEHIPTQKLSLALTLSGAMNSVIKKMENQ